MHSHTEIQGIEIHSKPEPRPEWAGPTDENRTTRREREFRIERDQATDLHTDLKVSHGSNGGWEEFGPILQATRSQGNVLFERDIQHAVVFRRIHPT